MKIISTIGPASEKISDLNKVIINSNIIRLNGSHNNLFWHKKIINRIKKIDPNITILFDIPGIKPRTLNSENIQIIKNEKITFYFKKKNQSKNKSIKISNQLPKINSKNKTFSIDDGLYIFKTTEYNENYITGISLSNFILKPKKGLNIIGGIYNDRLQLKRYVAFINKIKNFKIDSIGLSYIQSPQIIKKIKLKFNNLVIVSKIENFIGLQNIGSICKVSDAIMIDRGDLAAEIGLDSMYNAILNISNHTKINHLPLIMATENLTSMIDRYQPSKSDLIAIEHSKILGVDCIMLSEETATSINYQRTLNWLIRIVSDKKTLKKSFKRTSILDIQRHIENTILVIISKRGYIFDDYIERFKKTDNLYITNDKLTFHKSSFYKNFSSIYLKSLIRGQFDQSYIIKLVKKFKKEIFSKSNIALLIHNAFPKKNSRANSLTLINEKDFN